MAAGIGRHVSAVVAVALLVIAFFGVNIIAMGSLRSVRLDLTEDRLYTLSDGTMQIVRELEEPIRLRLFFTEELTRGQPRLETFSRRVLEMLEELVDASGGRLTLEVVDPEPFSEAEDEAVQNRLIGIPFGQGRTFYLGLVGTNSVDGKQVIPFLDDRREELLEYELSKLIFSLANPEKRVIGLLAGLAVDGTAGNPALGVPGEPRRQVMEDLRDQFEIRTIDPSASEIPADVDVLLVVHPKDVPMAGLYAIDRYVVEGGHAVILVDPNAEGDLPSDAAQNPSAIFEYDRDSDLEPLFGAWGIELEDGVVAGDISAAQYVFTQAAGGGSEPVIYPAWLSLTEANLSDDDPVTAGISLGVNLASAGSLRVLEDFQGEWTPLMQTTVEAMRIDVERVKFFPDPQAIVNEYEAGGEVLTVAARVTGVLPSAFADGPPEGVEVGDPVEPAPTNLIVIADVDVLEDQFWIQPVRLGEMVLGYDRRAANGDLILAAVDNLAGSTALSSIRTRGVAARPFERVEALRRAAEREYLAEEQRLQERLRDLERRIVELQSGRGAVSGADGSVVLTDEQRAEIERFRADQLETRRQLRAVRLNLRRDIEALGVRLKVLNIAAVPTALIVLALALAGTRAWRRRVDARRAAA